MENRDLPAMPITLSETALTMINRAVSESDKLALKTMFGMSKREMFAMAAMQGFCADGGLDYSYHAIAESSVLVADALLARLEIA